MIEDLDEGEADIEGMDYAAPYLWFTGSHSLKRKKAKGRNAEKDILRLETIKKERNRFILGRVALSEGGDPGTHAGHGSARLRESQSGNQLTDVLLDDPHVGPFLRSGIPSKDNGIDVEGLAVTGERVFLGLRGPVLRGWAVILEIAVSEGAGRLELKPLQPGGRFYRKHFVGLHGLGCRDLCVDGQDLVILAGPTMALDGDIGVFRYKDALVSKGDAHRAAGTIDRLLDVPATPGGDRAEGLALISHLGRPAILVVYDAPSAARRPADGEVYADIFAL